MTPIAPSKFAAVVPPAGATVAEAMRLTMLQFSLLLAQWYGSVYNEDGTFTNSFARDICDVRNNCPP